MYQFLDSCWLYGDKEVISQIYMCPIVMSTTYGGDGDLLLHRLIAGRQTGQLLIDRPIQVLRLFLDDSNKIEDAADHRNTGRKSSMLLWQRRPGRCGSADGQIDV